MPKCGIKEMCERERSGDDAEEETLITDKLKTH